MCKFVTEPDCWDIIAELMADEDVCKKKCLVMVVVGSLCGRFEGGYILSGCRE
ncbi:hypothetical protein M569_17417 [Genlisea aurea]|uniref:Uncharacterized protein n=1 Tax=Genlisea aurea TaxID=192259 RepID=S8BZ35_9LAMI|nr:hypothetical protein M569_17417 [Genlisea aurea]